MKGILIVLIYYYVDIIFLYIILIIEYNLRIYKGYKSILSFNYN